MAGPPLWRRAFDALERPVGDVLATGARSDAFADTLAVALRLQRRFQREIERRTRRGLHLVNLPAATDVRRLSEQVATLERQIRQLQHELDARDGRPARSRPRSRS